MSEPTAKEKREEHLFGEVWQEQMMDVEEENENCSR